MLDYFIGRLPYLLCINCTLFSKGTKKGSCSHSNRKNIPLLKTPLFRFIKKYVRSSVIDLPDVKEAGKLTLADDPTMHCADKIVNGPRRKNVFVS